MPHDNYGPRFAFLPREEMNEAQRDLYDRKMKGNWANLRGPFNALMRSPKMTDRTTAIGAYIRDGISLDQRLVELAILVTARHWTAQYEWYAHYPRALKWYAHYPRALKAGLPAAIADAIALGKRPAQMQPDDEAVYDFCTELHRTQRVGDATYVRAGAALSEEQIVDLIATCGFYVMISMVLNVAQAPIPDGVAPPLKALA